MTEEYSKALKEHIEYLEGYLKTAKGVNQGYLVYDVFGEVIHRVSRESNNAGWYRDFYTKHKRKPKQSELEDLAKQHLTNGFYDELGFVPPFEERQE